MSTTRDVAVFVGSLRKESFNRKMANALIAHRARAAQARDRRDRAAAALQPGRRGESPGGIRSIQGAHAKGGRGAVRHARVQPLGAGRAEERDRCRVAALRQERMERQARRGHQPLTGRDRCVRRQSSPAPIAGVPRMFPRCRSRRPTSARPRSSSTRSGRLADDAMREFLSKFLQAFAHWIERNIAK